MSLQLSFKSCERMNGAKSYWCKEALRSRGQELQPKMPTYCSVLVGSGAQPKEQSLVAWLCEAFALADPYLLFPGQDRNLRMSEATKTFDMKAFSKLTDHIFQQILSSCESNLHDAKILLERIQRRQLYTFSFSISPSSIVSELMAVVNKERSEKNVDIEVKSSDLIPAVNLNDYGMSDENPVDKINFYSKHSCDEGKPIKKSDISKLLPCQFKEGLIRMIVKPK
ncbi:Deoxynucleoside triphosphate triphosphohydrolase SAMHD1 [Nymphon striatum]|nr:Deoxynucleoside triphosphate triphosphohydrolase SAMHD1 [Nymphon striatum]